MADSDLYTPFEQEISGPGSSKGVSYSAIGVQDFSYDNFGQADDNFNSLSFSNSGLNLEDEYFAQFYETSDSRNRVILDRIMKQEVSLSAFQDYANARPLTALLASKSSES